MQFWSVRVASSLHSVNDGSMQLASAPAASIVALMSRLIVLVVCFLVEVCPNAAAGSNLVLSAKGTHTDLSVLQIPVGKDFRLSGKAVKRAITSNTILVVASSPGFPHGVVDHVQDIAQVSAEHCSHGGHHASG